MADTQINNSNSEAMRAALLEKAKREQARRADAKSVFNITTPDGKKYRVTGDNAEGAVAALKKMQEQQGTANQGSATVDQRAAAARDAAMERKASFMERLRKREAELAQNPKPSVMDRIQSREAELAAEARKAATERKFMALVNAAKRADDLGDTESAYKLVQAAKQLQSGGAAENTGGSSWQDAPIVGSGESGSWRDAPIVGGEPANTGNAAPDTKLAIEIAAAKARAKQGNSPVPPDLAEFSRAALAGENPPFEPLQAPIPRENEWLGGVMPSPRQAIRNLKENLIAGDNDPTTLNRGETVAAALNKAGESMTMGIVGDEAAGAIDAAMGRGNAADRTQFYRDQERQLWEQHPGVALGAEIGGALIGPGKGAGAFINAGKGTAARMGRAALASGAAGATYGAMEGEDAADRALGGAVGLGAGMAGGAAITGIGQGFLRAARAVKGHPALKEAIPTLEGLKESSQALFRAVEQSGATLPRGRAIGLSRKLSTTLQKEGYHPRLHPKVGVIMDELDSMSKSPLSMQQVMQLRRIAGGAAKSLEPDERRLASIAMDAIDNAVEALPQTSKAMKNARDLWGRMRRLELIENMIDDAARTQNFEQSLQTAARGFLRHGGKKLRGFSGAERQAIARIAKGSALQRSLAILGKRFSPTSLTGMAAAGGSAAYVSPTLGATMAGVGMASKAAGNAMIRGSANAARDFVAMSPARQQAVNALARVPNALAQYSPLSGIEGANLYLGKGD